MSNITVTLTEDQAFIIQCGLSFAGNNEEAQVLRRQWRRLRLFGTPIPLPAPRHYELNADTKTQKDHY